MINSKTAASVTGGDEILPAPEGGSCSAARWRNFWIGIVVLIAAFSPWIFAWFTFALNDSLASYVLLIPLISAYLSWQERHRLLRPTKRSMLGFGIALGAGLVLVG